MKVALADSHPRLDSKQVQALHARLEAARLLELADESWERGTPTEWLRSLFKDWASYSIEGLQDKLDLLNHLRADIDGVAVHLVHAPSTVPGAVPLLLTHGWPSSFLEYLHLLPLLTNPPSGDGGSGLAFHVVAPSLPGFGFSSPPPPGGFNHSDVAALWHRLTVEGLGYRRFVAHGSDLGAGVTIRPFRIPSPWLRSIWRRPGSPCRPSRGLSRSERTSKKSRVGPLRRAATPTSTPPNLQPSEPDWMTRQSRWPFGSAKSSTPGAAHRLVRLTSSTTGCWRRSVCTG